MVNSISYEDGILKLLDQRALPRQEIWLKYTDLEAIASAIESMVVRGAPAISCVAAFALVIDAKNFSQSKLWHEYHPQFMRACQRLSQTRPTAVNLFHVINKMRLVAQDFLPSLPMNIAVGRLEEEAMNIFVKDIQTCKAIANHALLLLDDKKSLNIITHCNAGSLATAGYGTALGVLRALHESSKIKHVYVDETRPFLQGTRLTAYELMKEGIECSIIVDSAAAYVMSSQKVDFVIVGADRIAGNGDTANKIGTYSLAISAWHHKIPFYVAAPLMTFDSETRDGSQINIEQRDPLEITSIEGINLAPPDARSFNPSFDVTPNNLISGFFTEAGVIFPPFEEKIKQALVGSYLDGDITISGV